MKNYIELVVPTKILKSISCDRCGRTYQIENSFEYEEFFYINQVGGYHSIFGDGTKVTADLCQHCIKELLGEYFQYEDV